MRPRLPDASLAAAAASGLLLALSFPFPGYAPLAWVGLVPLLTTMERRPFRNGCLAGAVFFAAVLYWLNIVMTTYGGLSLFLSVAVYLLLVAYLSLYFGAAAWLACRLRQAHGYSFVLTLPVIWVGLEFLREFLLTGFPWATLGYSQQSLAMIQSADLFGVYGISYLLLFGNAVASETVLAVRRSERPPLAGLLLLVLLLAGNYGYGRYRLSLDPDRRDAQLSVAVVQGNIDQAIKWDPAYQEASVEAYLALSMAAHGRQPADLVVWPEAATPFYFQAGGVLAERVRQLPVRTGAFLLFGSPAFRDDPSKRAYLNSAFLLSALGEELGRSDKVHLVPFGEYVPLKPLLPFVDKLVVGIGDFSPGEVSPLPMNGRKLGVLVCYEAIFPGLARDFVAGGSDLLINITNDAWFGRSSAPAQHLAMVRFRAIENRVWVARAANTGISAFVTPSGQVRHATGLFETTYATEHVGLGARPGLYAATGDLLPAAFLLVCLVWLLRVRRRPWSRLFSFPGRSA